MVFNLKKVWTLLSEYYCLGENMRLIACMITEFIIFRPCSGCDTTDEIPSHILEVRVQYKIITVKFDNKSLGVVPLSDLCAIYTHSQLSRLLEDNYLYLEGVCDLGDMFQSAITLKIIRSNYPYCRHGFEREEA